MSEKVKEYQKENSDFFMEQPNPYWKCPKCGAKQRYFDTKLNCHSFDHNGLVMGCLWCDCTFHEFETPLVIFEHRLKGSRFKLDLTKYEQVFLERLLEEIRDPTTDPIPFIERFYLTYLADSLHYNVARALDVVDMMAVDNRGGLRVLHRGFLEALAAVTINEEYRERYLAEITRREEMKDRPKKKKKSDEPPSEVKWDRKKPRAKERVGEASRGWHKDYYKK